MAHQWALNEIVRMRVACYTPSQVGMNVVHYRVSAIGGAGRNDAETALILDTNLEARYKAVISAGARYRGVSLQRIRPLPPTAPAISTAFDGVGTVAGDILATQVSGVVTSRTNFAGVKYRGRAYIPFPAEADSGATGNPIPDYVSRIDDLGDELFTPIVLGVAPDTVTFTPVIWHRADALATDITTFVARSQWATQRRRGAYGKMNAIPF